MEELQSNMQNSTASPSQCKESSCNAPELPVPQSPICHSAPLATSHQACQELQKLEWCRVQSRMPSK